MKYIIFLIPFIFFGQEKIHFNSKNPFSFRDIILDLESLEIENRETIYNFDLKQYKNTYQDWFKVFE